MLPVRGDPARLRHPAHAGHDQEDRTVPELQNKNVHAGIHPGDRF